MASLEMSSVDEETRIMLRSGITRICDIINNLLESRYKKNKLSDCYSNELKLDSVLLPSLIEPVLSEKRSSGSYWP